MPADDLVARLRAAIDSCCRGLCGDPDCRLHRGSLAKIDRLAARVAELETWIRNLATDAEYAVARNKTLAKDAKSIHGQNVAVGARAAYRDVAERARAALATGKAGE